MFANFLEDQYADHKIGDLEGQDEVEDDDEMLDYGDLTDGDEIETVDHEAHANETDMINEAVDEFI